MNEQALKNLGFALIDMIYAVKDGLDAEDLIAVQGLVVAALAAAPDIQRDVDSAGLMVVSGAAEKLARYREDPPVPAPE